LEIVKLKTRTRTGSGKSYTRKARAQGWVPAIFYGRTTDPISIEVDGLEFSDLVRNKHLTHLVDLGIGKKQDDSIAVIKEVQKHVIRNDFYYHIDFQHVAMNEKVTVHCPLHLIGIAVGVKDENGVLGHPIKSIMVECLPMDIPDKIEVDVSELHVGNSIHVRDISVPNVTIKDSPDEVVAVVTHASRETAEAAPKAEGEATPESATQAAPAAGAGAATSAKPAAPTKK
jgi:large subunit ribosomal protein L25